MWSYPQYQHESVEGNVGLEFNVHRFIPIPYQSMHPYLVIVVMKLRWH